MFPPFSFSSNFTRGEADFLHLINDTFFQPLLSFKANTIVALLKIMSCLTKDIFSCRTGFCSLEIITACELSYCFVDHERLSNKSCKKIFALYLKCWNILLHA